MHLHACHKVLWVSLDPWSSFTWTLVTTCTYTVLSFYKRVNITELSDFRKHWIPATPKDTTMSFGASPTVCWRKKAWSMVTLCLSSESVYVKSNQLFIDSKSLWLFVGDQFLWIKLVTNTHQFVRDAPVTQQITAPRT